jgi:hypothetical protein
VGPFDLLAVVWMMTCTVVRCVWPIVLRMWAGGIERGRGKHRALA